ncbi:uncharacterized protein K441DRAFT_671287 [Cenococcum geophilum 1.58]|uniref:Uncharacterized protein n=1 Tax=Cenococcum geophilum 1.58 TaxID=794803 RepID=A0ACC8ELH9_9PEZI|nr:hypothetical protein K441DRAFT_671287 [Cenococcum geophilum 1.58]
MMQEKNGIRRCIFHSCGFLAWAVRSCMQAQVWASSDAKDQDAALTRRRQIEGACWWRRNVGCGGFGKTPAGGRLNGGPVERVAAPRRISSGLSHT